MDQSAWAAADGSFNVVEDAGPVALRQCCYRLCVTCACCNVEGVFILLSSTHRRTNISFYKGALHQSRNEHDGHWVLGRTLPDLKLFLLLKHHNCIELSYLVPRIVRQVRPLPGVSSTCAVMINSLGNPVHMNLLELEELQKRPVRLRLK